MHRNRPFTTNDHIGPSCWRASSLLFPHWDVKTKRPQSVKRDWPLFLCPSGAIIMSLPSSMTDFVPCDRLLQKAYWNPRDSFFFMANMASGMDHGRVRPMTTTTSHNIAAIQLIPSLEVLDYSIYLSY